MSKVRVVLLLLVGFAVSSIAYAASKKFEKFLVYDDKPSRNHYVASGFMPFGKCVEIDDIWQQDCQGKSRSCIKSTFNRDCAAIGGGWAGVYWLQPANNWGQVQNSGFDLTGAKRLVFWAKGEKGGEVITFKMGGVGHQTPAPFPDTASGTTPAITLTKDWKEYSIDLKDKDLTRITGGFAWVGTVKENQVNAVFYIDNMYYE